MSQKEKEIKLTARDLDRIKEFIKAHNSPEDSDKLSDAVEKAFDSEIQDWAKGYAVTSSLGAAAMGMSGLELLYNTLIIGLYLGARMQQGKDNQMTVFLKFMQ